MGLQYMGKKPNNNNDDNKLNQAAENFGVGKIPQDDAELRARLGDEKMDQFMAAEKAAQELVYKLMEARHIAQTDGAQQSLVAMMEYASDLRRFINTKSDEEVGVLFTTVASAVARFIEEDNK